MVAEAVRQVSYIQAINEAIRQEMERDENVIVMGEDIAGGGDREDKQDAWGGPMRLTKGLVGQFGRGRVRDTPISEAGFVGAGVGAAASGLRPVVDLMYVGFYGVCADQITNNAAKIHYMFGGKVTIPLTIMTGTGAGTNSAAQHSETLYSIFTHFPGLKCVAPSDPYTAKGLMTAAIRDNDPVIVFNNRQLMGIRFDVDVPEEIAAAALEEQGYSVEVLDLLSLSPMDDETISSRSRRPQGRDVDEDYPRCSIASDISALVAEEAFDYLDAPPKRLNAPHAPVPYSRPLEALFVPTAEMTVEAALSVLE
ncbi:Acetoin:2,6-dichlorophenolindophenol oxidoreductase subunit beta [Geodia barretti]|uniref:Acetoin:2,6-dichlorophenolindophenol oxidoreductase subunit beta n=1 Tax=Geodia barretti TaxID=519541 RepID=A0AA35TXE0_GEOBA|nr:Acetoin:2,6-dichlorophenolindophenol oxidoreductase subunit beta [Geodia barretti]